MIRLAVLFVLFASPLRAMTWFCSAALVPDTQRNALLHTGPYSPTVLELYLDASGKFSASGEDRYAEKVVAFDWNGTWADVDGTLALIGPKQTENGGLTEMRAFTTHVGQQELIFNLTETAPWTQNVRCLKHDLG